MIHNIKSSNDLSGFYVVYKGSVLNESPENYGISHLMEHLMCKSYYHLYPKFSRYSISRNAITSSTKIMFHQRGLDDYIKKYKKKVAKCLSKFNITENQFKTELKVVIQEYKDRFQDQRSSHYYNIIRKEYGCYGPIGKLSALENLTFDDVVNYYDKFLSKPSAIINVSKYDDFDEEIEFNNYYPKNFVRKEDDVVFESMKHFSKYSIMGYKAIEKDFNYIMFIIDMLGKSMTSSLYKEMRVKRGLTYSIKSMVKRISDNQGLIMTNMKTTKENVETALNVYKEVFQNKEKHLTKKRFDIIKDHHIINRRMRDIERYSNIDEYIKPIAWSMEDIIDNITYDKVLEIYDQYFKLDTIKWSVDKEDFV